MPAVTIEDPEEAKAVIDGMLEKRQAIAVLVFMDSCPHCVAYKPKWQKLTEKKGAVNMVAVNANAYESTALSSQNPVSQVPTVVYVDETGAISEVKDHNNMAKMQSLLKTAPKNSSSNVFTISTSNIDSAESENPLPILPGTTSSEEAELESMRASNGLQQQGGNPMAAFLAAARAAAPAATLLGVYSVARSSGLGKAMRRRTRKHKRRSLRKTKGRRK
jgi:thioredoxin-like negative regulator of GroEL